MSQGFFSMRPLSVPFFVQTFTVLILAKTISFSNACAQTRLLPGKAPIPLARPIPFVTKKEAQESLGQVYKANHSPPTPLHNNAPLKYLKAGLDALLNNDIAKTISLRNSMEKIALIIIF